MGKTMYRFKRRLLSLSIIPVFFLFFSMAILADQGMAENLEYVDLDGDGINDNSVDIGAGRIPGKFNSKSELIAESSTKDTNYFISLDLENSKTINPSFSKSGKFDRRLFSVRGLTLCRGYLNSGNSFGPGAGIGAGVVNDVCPGGICVID